MQWLTLVPEDSGVQRLKADNRRPVVVRAVDAPAPCQPPQPAHNDAGTAPLPARRRERRSGGERRRRQVPVVLDTRCSDDRRQSATDETGQPTARRRINLYA